MPIYEYECGGCNHKFDLIQKIHDVPVKECPNCHQDAATRLISAAGFQLKGTGWYVTDFKDKGKPKPKTAESISGESGGEKKSSESTSSSSTKGNKD